MPLGAAVALTPVMAAAGLFQQFGWWQPVTAFGALAVGIVMAVIVTRRMPVPTVPAWAALAILVIAVAAGLWAGLTHGEHVAVRRDAGAYATYALSLAHFGGVPIDPQLSIFGLSATDSVVRVSAGANYQVPVVVDGSVVDLSVVPQFLIGNPAVLTLGWWAAGWAGLFAMPAIIGALALCAFGALGCLVAGPRVAVVATLALAVSQPILLVLRQTYSEPLSLLMLLAAAVAAVLAVQAGRHQGTPARYLGALAGGLLAANLFVRIDAAREIILLIPVLTLLALTRNRSLSGWVVALVAVGIAAYGAATPWSSPYLRQISASLIVLIAAGIVLAVVSAAVVAGSLVIPPALRRRIVAVTPATAALGFLAVAAFLVSRPLWLVDRRISELPGADDFVAALQREQGLALDPTRTYAENSVIWVAWWVGVPALLLATAAAAVALRRGLREAGDGGVPGWLVPLAVGVASTVLSLYRPAITPDHPWADRRLVTTVLPTVLLLAAVAVAWLAGRAGDPRGWRRTGTAAVGAALLVVPAATATAPVAAARTELGQPAAAEAVCGALPPRAAVIAVDHQSRVEWTPVLRAVCGVPIVGMSQRGGEAVAAIAADIQAAAAGARRNGYQPVVLSGSSGTVAALEWDWDLVATVAALEPQRLLVQRPDGTRALTQQLWLASPPE